MTITLLLLFGLILLFTFTIMFGRMINAQKYKIRSEAGIQKAGYITIGGLDQYVQIRGQNISNPVVIILHGGPGSHMTYYSYGWQAGLEQNYTIVHWDQRGCGNTYYRNKEAEKPTVDLLLSDLDALVEYIRLKYNKEKVIIMGHSWGTLLGGIYSGKHPEKVSAYISVSQMLDFKKSEEASAQEAARLANAAGKIRDAREIVSRLELIKTYQKLDQPKAVEFMKFRQLKEKYLPSQYGNAMVSLQLFSPYMTFNDIRWMLRFDKRIESNSALYESLLSDGSLSMYDYTYQYEAPVILIAGECDWTTPYSMALHYFNEISAPSKVFISIENAGHIPFIDKPKEFSETLLKALRNVQYPC